jgi:uncharacterized membrane protein YagU involved in acid resistance
MTPESQQTPDSVETPRPTAAPLVLALGLALLAVGVPFGVGFLVVGFVVVVAALSLWIAQLLPGRGHVSEPLAESARLRPPATAAPGRVERLRQGMPGYRIRLPEAVHPISAGLKGGIVGGLVMPVPALLWGLASGHGLWYPVNLLAGMALPGVGTMGVAALEQFHGSLLVAALVIHAVLSVVFGLIYGVLLPTLPEVPPVVAWGGLLAPLLWTGTSYALMGVVNPVLARGVSWPWFIASQFVFGLAAAAVVLLSARLHPVLAGLRGGIVGGLVMPVPALLWGLASGHGLWYPVNLLAGLVLPDLGHRPPGELEQFHADWLAAALGVHALLSIAFGVLLALLRGRLPTIPGPVAWGGLVLPLLWTGVSYALMGVVNPPLQGQVDWAWFVVSQFVFGVAAAVVVLRSATIRIPPAGRGPDRAADFVAGEGGARS